MSLRLLPAVVVLAVFAAALAALFRWSVLEFIPGSLQTGGLTLAQEIDGASKCTEPSCKASSSSLSLYSEEFG